MDGWVDDCLNGEMDEWVDDCLNGEMDEWVDDCLKGEMDEWVDDCLKGEMEAMTPTFAVYRMIDAVLVVKQLGRMVTRAIKKYPKMLMRNLRA